MEVSSPFDQVLLGCAPLVGPDRQVCGLRLSAFPAEASEQPIASAFLEGLEQALPERLSTAAKTPLPILVGFGSGALLDAVLGQRIPKRLAIEVPAFLAVDADRSSAIRRLHEQGVELATSGRALSTVPAGLLKCFRYLIADAADEQWGLARGASAPARTGNVLLEGLRVVADVQRAFEGGARGVVGWPLEEAPDKSRRPVNPSLKSIIELMDMVERQDSMDAMERVLRGDPTLAFRLLRLINSAAFGLRVEVTSFRHALMLLGHIRLKRWLSLLLVSSARDADARPLIHLAVRRGFMMEHLAKAVGEAEARDEMFVCGLFSLLDRLMGQPMAQLMEQIPMPARVQVSLLGAAGPYVAHLALISAIEQSSMVDIRQGAERVGVSPAALCDATLAAVKSVAELDE